MQVTVIALLRTGCAIPDARPLTVSRRGRIGAALTKIERVLEDIGQPSRVLAQERRHPRDVIIGGEPQMARFDAQERGAGPHGDAIERTKPGDERQRRLVGAQIVWPPVDRGIARHC